MSGCDSDRFEFMEKMQTKADAGGAAVSELGTCTICGRAKKALWDGPYDDELYCVSGMVTNHPAGVALPCYRRAYEKLKRDAAAAEERGRRSGVEAITPIIRGCQRDLEPITVQKNLAGDVARLVIEKLNAAITVAKLNETPNE